jgi:hypothetical protein
MALGAPVGGMSRARLLGGFLITIHIVVFSRVLFRASDLTSALDYVAAILTPHAGEAPFTALGLTVLVTAVMMHYLPRSMFTAATARYRRLHVVFQGAILAGVVLCLVALSPQGVPFVYFKF